MKTHALSPGIIVKGEKNHYRIHSLLRTDGMGFTYKAEVLNDEAAQGQQEQSQSTLYVVIREHFMPHCSSRGKDGATVVTPEELVPTVDSCLHAFEKSSRDREAVSARCPSLIDVVEIFPANNTYYYVVEYLDGQTLEEYVLSKGALSWEESRDLLSPIFDAVRAMHNFHLIHNTITPRHIRFVTQDGQKFPILFSLYSTIGFDENGLRQWNVPVMTCQPGYASPEQYTSMEHFTPATDIYSLAATSVFALSGRPLPAASEVNEEVIRKTLPPDMPENRVQALINALNPDPAHRTSSVTAFREELHDFYGGKRRRAKEDELTDQDIWKDILNQYRYPIGVIIIVILVMLFMTLF